MSDPSGWDRVARSWAEHATRFERAVQRVSLELVERAGLFAGERVLELACGPGGMLPLLAEAVAPGGLVIAGDASPGMVDEARLLSERLGLAQVEIDVIDLDSIDLETGAVGAIVSRFGYMFASDPGTALGEARRVLRPGGRIALAAWDVPERNPYGRIPLEALAAVGLDDGPLSGEPGMFRLSPPGMLAELLAEAGFLDVEISAVEVGFDFDSDADLIGWVFAHSQRVVDGIALGAHGSRAEFELELISRVAAHRLDGGAISLPGTALVASGRA